MPEQPQLVRRSCTVRLQRSTVFVGGIASATLLLALVSWSLDALAQQSDWARGLRSGFGTTDAPTLQIPSEMAAPIGSETSNDVQTNGNASQTSSSKQTLAGLTIVPSVGLTESFTDNASQSTTHRVPDFYTTLSPDLFVTDVSPRLRGVFNFNPQLIHFVRTSNEDTLAINGLVNGTATLYPDLFFISANASANQYSRSGYQGIQNPGYVPATQQTQQYAYSLAPYALFRLGRDIDGQVRYQFSQTLFNGNTGTFFNQNSGQVLPPLSGGMQNEISGKLQTDPSAGRIQGSVSADALDFVSADPLLSSRNINAIATAAYLVTHSIWLTAGGGYQDLTYPREPQIDFIGPIWSVGAKYQSGTNRVIALSYGEYEGHFGFNGFANYALTPIFSLFGSYYQNISTMQQDILQNLPNATQLVPGQTIDQTTGLPLAISNPNLALQNGIFFTTTARAGASAVYSRNTFTLSANYVDEKSLIPTFASSQRATGLLFSWSRQLSPDMAGLMSLGYSLLEGAASLNGTTGASNQVQGSLGVTYKVSATLTASASYTVWDTPASHGPGLLMNVITVGVRKVF